MDIIKVILTAFLSVAVLFAITKLMGHKQMAQLDFFDYINGITIGSIAAELATELENPIHPLIAMVTYCIIAIGLTFSTSKFPRLRKYINGSPTIIMSDGKIMRKNMKKSKLDLSEFMVMCRQQGYFNLNDIAFAVFEYNGNLTILPKATKRPVNPTDINIVPPPEQINTEVIMDGRILGENLARLGLDEKWLGKELKCLGYKNAKQIILATCDNSKNLTLFT